MKSLLLLVAAAVIGSLAFAHPGGLDANGGHNDRKNGGYHYHRQQPAAAAPAAKAKEPEKDKSTAAPKETGFWITTSSGVRHNPKCRYYKTSKGRPCEKDEGRACKICGG